MVVRASGGRGGGGGEMKFAGGAQCGGRDPWRVVTLFPRVWRSSLWPVLAGVYSQLCFALAFFSIPLREKTTSRLDV